ncbi:hypothetical protein GUJ93_ZPchr0002g25613 [Zizania palustris]|uniref:AUGMIN subunit 8 n=1 Tax=Zizania palustris TaxID=103762 RepID=A0A8J5S692_ZIZPA|nr:hypothetical protein GUJ93_ZPchr0002g25613 [Zizania palustris]
MDACGIQAPADVLLRKSDLPAEKNCANGHSDAALRRKAAEAMQAAAPATPRRHPSPNAGRASAPEASVSQARRSQSTERKPATPSRLSPGGSRATTPSRISAPTSPSSAPSSPSSSSSSSSTPVRDAASESQSIPRKLSGGRAPDGLWPSMRSLSSSLQVEVKGKTSNGSSADQTKTRDAAAAAAADRKRSPLRGRRATEQLENPHAKVIDHHRWPAMMGGRVSMSAMSRSLDLTDKIARPTLSSIPSRGVSPKKTPLSSAANTLSRSIDLADKIDRLVSSSVSSRGGSPRTSTASNSMSVCKDAKPATIAIPSRVSPIRTASSGVTRTLPKNMDLTEKDNSALSAISSPGISPGVSVSSVSNATSHSKSSRGISPRRISTSGGSGAISRKIDLPENDKRPAPSSASLRGNSPRRRLASDGVSAVVKNMDFVEKDSRPVISSIPSRGVSPRRRLASDGVDAISRSTDFSDKDNRPSTLSSSALCRISPLRRLASDGINAISQGMDSTDKAYRPSTSSAASRVISSRTRLASDGAGNISKSTDFADRDNKSSTSSTSSRGMSPRRHLASDGINSISDSTTFTEKDTRTMLSSVASQGISTIRCLPENETRSATSSAPSRGLSPRRRLASDGVNAISKGIDLADKDSGPAKSTAALRGVSPRRQLASDRVDYVSKSTYFTEKDKDTRLSTSLVVSRGISPRRRPNSDGVDAISKGINFTEKNITPSTSSMQSRGISPRRRLASDGVNALLKSTDFADKDYRPSTSSSALRGTSPRNRVASNSINAISRSMDFADKDNRPLTSSGALRGTLQRGRLASDGINALLEVVNTTSNGCSQSTSSASSESMDFDGIGTSAASLSITSQEQSPSRTVSDGTKTMSEDVNTTQNDNRAISVKIPSRGASPRRRIASDSTGTVSKSMDFAEEVSKAIPHGCNGDISESMDFDGIGISAASLSITLQEQSPSRAVSDGTKTMSEDVNTTQNDNRAISVKIPSRGASPRRRIASDGTGTVSKSTDFADKDRKSLTMSIPSRGMSPRRTARSGIIDMSKSMDFSEKCNGPISSIVPSRLVSARRILGPDGANAMSRSMDLTDKIKQPISSTVQSCRVSPRKMTLADSRAKGPDLLPGDVRSPSSSHGNESQEENAGSSLDAPSNDSEKSAPPKRLARTLSSPLRGLVLPSSPIKASSTSSFTPRRMPSPLRIRPSTPVSPCSSARSDSASSILSYIGDATKGKKSPSHMEDSHQSRLLYNRSLQWRFTNAYVDEMLSAQKMSAETMLYSVWDANSRLCNSMVMKRSYVQRLRQEVKLGVVLKEQTDYLTHWAALETEHSTSLSSASDALRASTLRLPVTGGAKADVLTVKNAVSSAVDIMQAMGSSICYLLSKLHATHSLVTELSAVAAKESTMLNDYRELLGTAAALQVQESSLRTQLIQQTE